MVRAWRLTAIQRSGFDRLVFKSLANSYGKQNDPRLSALGPLPSAAVTVLLELHVIALRIKPLR
jgi:hypothetical protein